MSHDTTQTAKGPAPSPDDPLTELLRRGARELIHQAVEAELQTFMDTYAQDRLPDGRQAVVRNGYQPRRQVQTGIGDVVVQVPKTRDRAGAGRNFTSSLLPPYLRRTRSVEELRPWLYLKGVSSGDFQVALSALLGEQAQGLSASTLGRLKQQWLNEHSDWRDRDLSAHRYSDWWADGIHFNLRGEDNDRACLLVIIGVLPDGNKEFVALDDGVRESEQSGYEILVRLRDYQRLSRGPKLAIGDGALGFWKALMQVYPSTRGQRCWVHKTANVLNKLSKATQPRAKSALQSIWMAETRADAEKAFDAFLSAYGDKYSNTGVLRLPGHALAVHPHHQSYRVDVRHRAAENGEDPRMCYPQYDSELGLQAWAECAEALAPTARLPTARQARQARARQHVHRWDREHQPIERKQVTLNRPERRLNMVAYTPELTATPQNKKQAQNLLDLA